jgi:hypothetical protein
MILTLTLGDGAQIVINSSHLVSACRPKGGDLTELLMMATSTDPATNRLGSIVFRVKESPGEIADRLELGEPGRPIA